MDMMNLYGHDLHIDVPIQSSFNIIIECAICLPISMPGTRTVLNSRSYCHEHSGIVLLSRI